MVTFSTVCVINSVFASLQWNVTHLRELDPRQKCKRCVQFHKWDECVSLISSSGAISRCVQFPQKEEIAIEKSGWMNPNCSLSCCNFFLPSVCNFVLFQLLTCFTIEFMLHTTNYASRFTPLDLRYKNGNTVAISENWYQILCGPKSSPRFQNVQGSDASTRLKTGGEPRSCAISQASFYVFYANFFQVHNNLLHLSRQNKRLIFIFL